VGKTAHLLVGALSHSGCWRGVFCESEDHLHLIDGLIESKTMLKLRHPSRSQVLRDYLN